MITVTLADDHHIVRHGIKALLEAEPDMRVVGEAGCGMEASQITQKMKPDVLVLDLMMPDINGLKLISQIKKRSPNTSIVVLSMYGNDCYVLEALQAGAKAYVLKDSPQDEFVRAVREAAAGHRYLAPPLSDRAIEAYLLKTEDTKLDPYDMLTFREREVLHQLIQGSTNVEISEQLCISRRTVEVHRARIMKKLGLHGRAELIHYAILRGILPEGK
ncbi:MAG: response regulator transcription factor [Dehalococcoidia bacterium]|nr:response regulator transcription factor [Dehalococcoidia bacterium]MDD5495196.1 response regulator transcription factor [Dehalococcoidia bacterium]